MSLGCTGHLLAGSGHKVTLLVCAKTEVASDWEAQQPKHSQDTSSANAYTFVTTNAFYPVRLSQGLKENKQFGKEGAFLFCIWSVTAGVAGVAGFLMSEL